MKIPKTLKIGSHIYKVRLVKKVDREDSQGSCDTQKNIIEIKRNMKPDQIEATLVHETFHALNTTINHELLDSLSEQLYQAIKDNGLFQN